MFSQNRTFYLTYSHKSSYCLAPGQLDYGRPQYHPWWSLIDDNLCFEGNGLDYHFISRTEFDESIAAGAFLEYGMNKSGALYGTLLSEVEKIIDDNRIPLLCPPPQSLEKIKNRKYKAHVVFLKVILVCVCTKLFLAFYCTLFINSFISAS